MSQSSGTGWGGGGGASTRLGVGRDSPFGGAKEKGAVFFRDRAKGRKETNLGNRPRSVPVYMGTAVNSLVKKSGWSVRQKTHAGNGEKLQNQQCQKVEKGCFPPEDLEGGVGGGLKREHSLGGLRRRGGLQQHPRVLSGAGEIRIEILGWPRGVLQRKGTNDWDRKTAYSSKSRQKRNLGRRKD